MTMTKALQGKATGHQRRLGMFADQRMIPRHTRFFYLLFRSRGYLVRLFIFVQIRDRRRRVYTKEMQGLGNYLCKGAVEATYSQQWHLRSLFYRFLFCPYPISLLVCSFLPVRKSSAEAHVEFRESTPVRRGGGVEGERDRLREG